MEWRTHVTADRYLSICAPLLSTPHHDRWRMIEVSACADCGPVRGLTWLDPKRFLDLWTDRRSLFTEKLHDTRIIFLNEYFVCSAVTL